MKIVYFFVAAMLANVIQADDSLDELDFDIDDLTISLVEESKPWRLAFAWQNGADLNALDNTTTHRFDSRLNWEQLLFKDYFFKLDGKAIVRLPGDDNQSGQSSIELDGRLRELYLQNSDEFWTLTAGFQILTLGEMDAVQVSDMFSPWDYSEFALTAPEDARLGQLMVNAQWYSGSSRWQLVYSPWPLSNRYPGGNADTLIQRLLGAQTVEVEDNQPKPFRDYEFLFKWQETIEGSDVTLTYANLLSNDPLFQRVSEQDAPVARFETDYFRFDVFAASANVSAGNFLWKLETAYKKNMQYQAVSVLKSDAWDFSLGVDYDANSAWSLSVEMLNQRLLTVKGQLKGFKKDNTRWLARWRKDWLHETLSTVLFVSYQWQYGDSIASMAFDYAVDDAWKVSLVGSVFNSTDSASPAQLTKDWDQLVLRVSYSR